MPHLTLQKPFQYSEGNSRLCRRTTLRDIDDTETLIRKEVHQLAQIVFADVMPSENDVWSRVLSTVSCKGRSQCLNDSTSPKVTPPDTNAHHIVTTLLQSMCGTLNLSKLIIGNFLRQVNPSKEVVS